MLKEIINSQQISGDEFNIFRIFEIDKDEVKHSRFLAELLNPKGLHFQNTLFLDEFINTLKINEKLPDNFIFNTSQAQLEVEKSIGVYGRIDILLCDNDNTYIVIENKIDAKDQNKQLGRYYQYVKDKNHKIFYLTKKDNCVPKEISLVIPDSQESLESNDYTCISYEKIILPWLESCLLKPIPANIRYIINQYISVLTRDVLKKDEGIFYQIDKEKVLRNFLEELSEAKFKFSFPDISCFFKGIHNRISIPIEVEETKELKPFVFYFEILNNFYYGIKSSEEKLNENARKELENAGYRINNDGFIAWKYPYNLSSERINFRYLNLAAAQMINNDQCNESVKKLVEIITNDIKELSKIILKHGSLNKTISI